MGGAFLSLPNVAVER